MWHYKESFLFPRVTEIENGCLEFDLIWYFPDVSCFGIRKCSLQVFPVLKETLYVNYVEHEVQCL